MSPENRKETPEWPSCDYSPGRNHWLFVPALVCVAACEVVVLRDQNTDLSLIVEPIMLKN